MSMNLICNEVELIQTPTHITYLCYYAVLPRKGIKARKSPWQTIMAKYLMWITETIGNVNQDWNFVKSHKNQFEWAVKKHGKLYFHII